MIVMMVKVVRVCEMDVVRARDLLRFVVRGPPRWHFDETPDHHSEHHQTKNNDGEYERRGVDAFLLGGSRVGSSVLFFRPRLFFLSCLRLVFFFFF